MAIDYGELNWVTIKNHLSYIDDVYVCLKEFRSSLNTIAQGNINWR